MQPRIDLRGHIPAARTHKRVIGGPAPHTAVGHGLSHQEYRLVRAAETIFRRSRRPLTYMVASAPRLPEEQVRHLIRDVHNRIVLCQKRAGMQRGLWFEILEGAEDVHANIFFPDPAGIGDRLARAPAFAKYDDEIGTFLECQSVYDLRDAVNYCLKLSTPEAHFAANREFRRVPGSHPLGRGGGDRVRMSEDLERILRDKGQIEPRTRTYASRSIRRQPPPPAPSWTVDEAGQFQLFSSPAADIRLSQFWSGKMPPTVANDVETIRKARGWTQAEMARRAGISRPQYVNAVVGRFGLSRQPVARLQALLLEAA